DDFDEEFGDGSDLMDITMPDDSAIPSRHTHYLQQFNNALNKLHLKKCSCCREEGFSVKLRGQTGECGMCNRDKKVPKLWSDENHVNPTNSVPECLKGLTDMEEMLIARMKTIMQVRWTKGRQLCYQDHIVNLPQNIDEVA
ncbi:hypothetical protein C8J56DRAFT_783711, partial [Mycena floridula]